MTNSDTQFFLANLFQIVYVYFFVSQINKELNGVANYYISHETWMR